MEGFRVWGLGLMIEGFRAKEAGWIRLIIDAFRTVWSPWVWAVINGIWGRN